MWGNGPLESQVVLLCRNKCDVYALRREGLLVNVDSSLLLRASRSSAQANTVWVSGVEVKYRHLECNLSPDNPPLCRNDSDETSLKQVEFIQHFVPCRMCSQSVCMCCHHTHSSLGLSVTFVVKKELLQSCGDAASRPQPEGHWQALRRSRLHRHRYLLLPLADEPRPAAVPMPHGTTPHLHLLLLGVMNE